jgi:hypothetical protein
VLDLTAATKYVQRLLSNTQVRRYLSKHHEETLAALEQLLAESDADRYRRADDKPDYAAAAITVTAPPTVAEGTHSLSSQPASSAEQR